MKYLGIDDYTTDVDT